MTSCGPGQPPGASVATGILDDEAYDWASVVDALLRTGGTAIAVGEDDLMRANAARPVHDSDRRRSRPDPRDSPVSSHCVTRMLSRRRGRHPSEARAAVLFTG